MMNMTPTEFKTWAKLVCTGVLDVPTPDQLARVVKTITGKGH